MIRANVVCVKFVQIVAKDKDGKRKDSISKGPALNLNSPLLVGVKRKSRLSGQRGMNSNIRSRPAFSGAGVS